MYDYALINFKGEGIPVNMKEAAKYFKLSADKKYSFAANYYARMLSEGDGIPADMEESVKYYDLAKSIRNKTDNCTIYPQWSLF